MNFLLMLAAGIAVLALIITGLLFVTSSGDSEKKSQSKTALKYSIWGFIVIFISWIIIDFVLIGWGYLDPLGGEWSIVDCDVDTAIVVAPPPFPPPPTFCGDGVRQSPNDVGTGGLLDDGNEECDLTDSVLCGGLGCSVAGTCICNTLPTFCGDGVVQSPLPNDAGTGGPANDGVEECDTDGSSCGALVCEADCTCKTDPTPGVCGVWFSALMAGNPPGSANFQTPFNLTDTYGGDLLSNWVGNGDYPDSSGAFYNAVYRTFDGIAIDKNTNLKLWDGGDYKNQDGTTDPILDITGPMIINNCQHEDKFVGARTLEKCFGLTTATPSWGNCMTSDLNGDGDCNGLDKETMNDWASFANKGSVKITCTAP